mmetsp:Transcript_22316/g.27357  ORF Transcript_22316/g.27357 Transcript_22316/m.27357 type:complete len:107 (-) Transcript_22316:79-399(-)
MFLRLIFPGVLVLSTGVSSWTIHLTPLQNRKHSITVLNAEERSDENNDSSSYGVSWIGGDPCASKYNNDPFDTQVTKPGMPQDMKERIQALAEKKIKEKAGESPDK